MTNDITQKNKLLEWIVEDPNFWKGYVDTLCFMKGRIEIFGEELGIMRIPRPLLTQEANETVLDYFLALANDDKERKRLVSLKEYVSVNQRKLANHWQYFMGEYSQD